MKRRLVLVGIVTFIILAIPVRLLLAEGHFRSPTKDTACYKSVNNNCYDNYGVQVSASADSSGRCNPDAVGYIGWDLGIADPDYNRTWSSATLTLTAYSVTGGEPPFTFALYAPDNHDWTEDGMALGYGGTAIATATVPSLAVDGVVTFESDALGAYFLGLKGGDASLAVVMTGGCGAQSATVVFEDVEGTGNLYAPSSAKEADLVFLTESNLKIYLSFITGG